MASCGFCNRRFKTRAAVKQHVQATHSLSWTCPDCSKACGSAHTIRQHLARTGHVRPTTTTHVAAGMWVLAEHYSGCTSWGLFVCPRCPHQWLSQAALPTYLQWCETCYNAASAPRLMWLPGVPSE